MVVLHDQMFLSSLLSYERRMQKNEVTEIVHIYIYIYTANFQEARDHHPVYFHPNHSFMCSKQQPIDSHHFTSPHTIQHSRVALLHFNLQLTSSSRAIVILLEQFRAIRYWLAFPAPVPRITSDVRNIDI